MGQEADTRSMFEHYLRKSYQGRAGVSSDDYLSSTWEGDVDGAFHRSFFNISGTNVLVYFIGGIDAGVSANTWQRLCGALLRNQAKRSVAEMCHFLGWRTGSGPMLLLDVGHLCGPALGTTVIGDELGKTACAERYFVAQLLDGHLGISNRGFLGYLEFLAELQDNEDVSLAALWLHRSPKRLAATRIDDLFALLALREWLSCIAD